MLRRNLRGRTSPSSEGVQSSRPFVTGSELQSPGSREPQQAVGEIYPEDLPQNSFLGSVNDPFELEMGKGSAVHLMHTEKLKIPQRGPTGK